MPSDVWDPDEIEAELAAWVADPANRLRLMDEPERILRAYADGTAGNAGLAGAQLRWRHLWRLREAAYATLGMEPEGPLLLAQAYRDGFWHVRVMSAWFGVMGGQRPRALLSFNDTGITLAAALALGLMEDARELGPRLNADLARGVFHGVENTRVAPFVLRLFGEWSGEAVTDPRVLGADLGGFGPLLAAWRTPDAAAFTAALLGGCDEHVLQSGEPTDETGYDFHELVYRLFPVELLAVLRLRRLEGLTTPVIDHPLLASPLGLLYDPPPPLPDPLLEAVRKRLAVDLPALGGPTTS